MSFAALIVSVSENNFKRLKIGVNVAEYRKPHRALQYGLELENSLRFCVWTFGFKSQVCRSVWVSFFLHVGKLTLFSVGDFKSLSSGLGLYVSARKFCDVASQMAV